ncbi:MAG: CBS domain-containing protein [Candidatus Bathyarchaeota archaeon]|nr:CBS domain-containing protein [Candidatus Bathyarchaeota archaeon]
MLPEISEIKKRRKNLDLTQKRLADLTGVSQSLIAKIESGKLNPSYSIAKSIFETLESLERRTEITAKNILSPKVIYVDKDEPLSRAMELMEENGYSQLPVFDGNQSIGSVSERTILDLITKGEKLSRILKQPVKIVMEEAFPRISENTSLIAISALLRYNQAVLVTKKDRCVGIITKTDLFKVARR